MIHIDFQNFMRMSDWNGYEVGFPEVSIVGLYRLGGTDVHFYINMENGEVLEYWSESDDD